MKENCKTNKHGPIVIDADVITTGDLPPKYGMLETTIDRRYKITADIFIQQGTMKIEAECNEEDVESVARTIADLFKYKQKQG